MQFFPNYRITMTVQIGCGGIDIFVSPWNISWFPFLTIRAWSQKRQARRILYDLFTTVHQLPSSESAPCPSPSPCYSLTHAHRSICYRNCNPQPLAESSARLMYLCVHDSRDNSRQSAPSPSLCYKFTHAHITLPTLTLFTITCTQVL